MMTEEFWQLAYIAQLNNSREPVAQDRASQATLTADFAVRDLKEFRDREQSE